MVFVKLSSRLLRRCTSCVALKTTNRMSYRMPQKFYTTGVHSSYLINRYKSKLLVLVAVSTVAGSGFIRSLNTSRRSIIRCLEAESVCVDADADEDVWSWTVTFWLMLRLFKLCLLFTPVLILYPLTWTGSAWLCEVWWSVLLLVVERWGGPTLIKLGQWAATRRDMFSAGLCNKLSRLHTRATPHAWRHTVTLLEAACGGALTGVTREPVGSGCVAQVYKAYLPVSAAGTERDDDLTIEGDTTEPAGDFISAFHGLFSNTWAATSQPIDDGVEKNHTHLIPVAVKVLHPGVRDQVCTDVRLLSHLAHIITSCCPATHWLSLTHFIREFSEVMRRQTDLRWEASCLDRFNLNFPPPPPPSPTRSSGAVSTVRFPAPVRPYVTADVLVETWQDGVPLTKIISGEVKLADNTSAVYQKIARTGVEAILKMIFIDNFVHADLHPGNILLSTGSCCHDADRVMLTDTCETVGVRPERSDQNLDLVFLDTGITSSLTASDFDNFRNVFTAVLNGDGYKVGSLMLTHSPAHMCADPERFKLDVARLVKHSTDNLQQMNVGELLSSIFSVLMSHHVRVESNFASVILALMVVEGLGRSLDPNLDIIEIAAPYILTL